MPHIAQRDEENNTRKKRLAQLARGPGVFVYDGSLEDTESIPTPLLTGDKEVLFGDDGLPVVDRSGRPVYRPAGKVVTDYAGKIVYGGVPKIERIKRETVTLRGVEFKAGEPVKVDSALALKLRGMPGFEELSSDEAADVEPKSRPALNRAAELDGEAPPARRRGRPPKAKEASAEE